MSSHLPSQRRVTTTFTIRAHPQRSSFNSQSRPCTSGGVAAPDAETAVGQDYARCSPPLTQGVIRFAAAADTVGGAGLSPERSSSHSCSGPSRCARRRDGGGAGLRPVLSSSHSRSGQSRCGRRHSRWRRIRHHRALVFSLRPLGDQSRCARRRDGGGAGLRPVLSSSHSRSDQIRCGRRHSRWRRIEPRAIVFSLV